MITDFIQYDEAFKVAVDFATEDGETAVIGTPDHNTGGMKLGNYRNVYTSMQVEELTEPLKKMKLTGEGLLRMTEKDFDEITASDLQEVVLEYWGIDLSGELAQEIVDFSEKNTDIYRSSPVAVLPLTYGLGKIISEHYTVVGWTSFGHNGDNCKLVRVINVQGETKFTMELLKKCLTMFCHVSVFKSTCLVLWR
jgi:alkaline phosphatase